MNILPLLIPIISIISISTFFSIVFQKRMSQFYFLSIFIIVLIIFLCGLTNFEGSLLLGYFIVLLLSACSLFYIIKTFLKDKNKIKRIHLLESIIIFLLFFILSLFVNYGRMFTMWDEFSFWGSIVKGMYSFDALGTFRESTLLIESYIPGSPLLGYFFTRPFSAFVEFPAYIGINMLFFSLILTMVKKFNLRNFIFLISSLFLPFLMTRYFYSTLYVDCLMGILFGFIILLYFRYRYEESSLGILFVSATTGMLAMIKDMGLIFSGIAILIIFLDSILFRTSQIKNFLFSDKNKLKIFKQILIFITPVFTCLLIAFLWRINLKLTGTVSSLDNVEGDMLLNLLNGHFEPNQIQIIESFKEALISRPIIPLNLSFSRIVIGIFSLATVLIFTRKRQFIEYLRLSSTFLTIFAGNFMYLCILLFSYVFIFSEFEANALASYDRYMLSYIIGFFYILLLFTLEKPTNFNVKKKFFKFWNCLSIIIFIIAVFFSYNFLYNNTVPYIKLEIMNARDTVKQSIEMREPYNKILDWSEFLDQDSKLYFISQMDKGFNKLVIMHTIYPSNMKWVPDYSVSTEPYYSEYPWTKIISPVEWDKYVYKNYDFLYIFNYDERFSELYGIFFDAVKEHQLYKVTLDESGKLLLISLQK